METRDRIVRSAARLFLTRSYHSVGISDLCTAADVRKGSFYHFFPSKADLAKAVIDLHADELTRRLDQARDETPDDDPAAWLRAIADAIGGIQDGFERRFGRIVGCPFGNLAAELSTTDEELRSHVAGVFARWEATLAQAAREAAAGGALRDGVEPDLLAHMILAQVQGLIVLAKVSATPRTGISAGLRALIAANLRKGALT
jgi:TetR/AcrR family transcriptional regulator, transcriptional repressor for nem operon